MSGIYQQLNPDHERLSFRFVGKAFFGKKNVSTKDNSFTSTLWMSFLYLPIIPYDTYRVMNTGKGWLPKVYGFDEYITIKNVRLEFDWFQVVRTLGVIYGSLAAGFFAWLFISLEFGAIYSLVIAVLAIGSVVSVIYYNHKKLTKPAVVNKTIVAAPKPAPQPESKLTSKPEYVPELEPEQVHEPEAIPEPEPSPVVVPQPVVAVTKAEPVKAAVATVREKIVEPVTKTEILPGQRKFDPNKMMEWGKGTLDLHPELVKQEEPEFGTVGVFAILNIILLAAQLILEFYFILNPGQSGLLGTLEQNYQSYYGNYALSATGIIIAVLAMRKDPLIAIALLFISVAFAMELQSYVFDFFLKL